MELTKKEKMIEKDAIVTELFKGVNDLKSYVASISDSERENLVRKIANHVVFFDAIVKEDTEKSNFRIETAKLRAYQIYPQLAKLIQL